MKIEDRNFRYFIRVSRQRSMSSPGLVAAVQRRVTANPEYYKNRTPEKIVNFSLTIPQLKKLWLDQKGRCAHTNIELELPITTNDYDPNTPLHRRASLDRIDSNGDYCIENVQFVSYMSNLAKNRFKDQDVLAFYNEIKNLVLKEHLFDV
jgi:hypothetical protein